MIGLYFPRRTWLHKLKAGNKLLMLAVLSLILLQLNDILILALVLLASCAIYLVTGSGLWRELRLVKHILYIVLCVLAIHYWMNSFAEGLAASMKFVSMFLLAMLVSLTTKVQDMQHAIEPILRPLKYLGIPPKKISLAMAMLVRFTPVLLIIWHKLDEAWCSRGGGNFKWRLVAPTIVATHKISEHVGEALYSRGGSEGMQQRDNS